MPDDRQPARRGFAGSSRTRARQLRRDIRAYVKSIRARLIPFDVLPRDARAWARRDRIDVLLTALESGGRQPLKQIEIDGGRLYTTVLELEEWLQLEDAFQRDYPISGPPAHWTSRDLSPATRRKSERTWAARIRGIRRALKAKRGQPSTSAVS